MMSNLNPLGSKNPILLSDSTLRDGSHAIQHSLTPNDVSAYCSRIDKLGFDWIEVGHGNGLGASSYHIGRSAYSDRALLEAARSSLSSSKLSVHVMPGIASIKRDIFPAINAGVDVFRVASHCSEADTTLRYIEIIKNENKSAIGVLMMAHMLTPKELIVQAKQMENAGADGIMIMDSAGTLDMSEIEKIFSTLTSEISIPLGVHAHNNLGLAIANSIVAIKAGAQMVDACAAGFGAGAGNAAMEVLLPHLNRIQITTYDSYEYFNVVDDSLNSFIKSPQVLTPLSIATGLAGLFSGYLKPIIREAESYGLNVYDIVKELESYKLVAGQEDIIIEVAEKLYLRSN
jgi:4-hydroxy 2-oxovalerate aldolase